jgi:hypothetical protein
MFLCKTWKKLYKYNNIYIDNMYVKILVKVLISFKHE